MPNISEIIRLHDKLAEEIKRFENTTKEAVPLETLNEMRYALRAVMEMLPYVEKGSLSSEEQGACDKAKHKAFHALLCAYHDLLDLTVLDLTNYLDDLKNRFLPEMIQVLEAKRIDMLRMIDEANALVETSRGQKEQRQQIYEQQLFGQHFGKLLKARKDLEYALNDIVKLHEANQKERQQKKRIAYISVGVGLISLVLGVLSFI